MTRIIIHPPTSPDSGPDRRIRAEDRLAVTFARSSWTASDDRPHTGDVPYSHVEVQSFISDGVPVTALVIAVTGGEHNYAGSSSLMLSGDEARKVAEMLILAANDQDFLRSRQDAAVEA